MGETGKYTADPAKAQAAVEAMEDLEKYVFNMAARFRNGINFDVLGNDKHFGAKAKPVAIDLVDQIATGVEAASRMLGAVPTALRANQKSVVNQQGRALTAVHDAKSAGAGGWRTPSSFGGRE